MRGFTKWLGALALLVMAGVYAWPDASPGYIQEFNGTGTSRNTVVWSLDYNGNVAQTGSVISTGTTSTGVASFTGSSTSVYGLTVFPQTTYSNIFASNTVIPSSTYLNLVSSGGFPGDIKLTSTPNISTTTALNTTAAGTVSFSTGTMLILMSGSTNQITLQDNSSLTNSGLNLISATEVITSTRSIELIFNGATGRWTQIRGRGIN